MTEYQLCGEDLAVSFALVPFRPFQRHECIPEQDGIWTQEAKSAGRAALSPIATALSEHCLERPGAISPGILRARLQGYKVLPLIPPPKIQAPLDSDSVQTRPSPRASGNMDFVRGTIKSYPHHSISMTPHIIMQQEFWISHLPPPPVCLSSLSPPPLHVGACVLLSTELRASH